MARGVTHAARPGGSAVAAVAAVVLLLVLVATVASVGGGHRVAEARGLDRPRLTGTAPAPRAVTTTPGAPADVRLDVGAPRREPDSLLVELADHRAAAWREGTPALLTGADAQGSEAATRDAAAVTEMLRAGVRYTGLRHTVSEVDVITTSARAAVLRARIGTSAYAVTGPPGVGSPRPAQHGDELMIDLVWTDVGWRISDARPAS